jgi:hypothetical protein
MTVSDRPEDLAVARCWERVRASRQWSWCREMRYPPGLPFVEIFRELFPTLVPEGRALPRAPVRSTRCDLEQASLDEAYLTAEGDGVLAVSRHRGFMPGMGQTLTYFVVAGDEVCVEVEDYWEDNIADPDSAPFQVRGRSAQDLARATSAVSSALAARGVAPL